MTEQIGRESSAGLQPAVREALRSARLRRSGHHRAYRRHRPRPRRVGAPAPQELGVRDVDALPRGFGTAHARTHGSSPSAPGTRPCCSGSRTGSPRSSRPTSTARAASASRRQIERCSATRRRSRPIPYRESHLEVRHMDAKQLEFPDDSFDAVFTLSSIEHFGSWANIRQSAREMGRVLRPGGCAFVVTECLLGRSCAQLVRRPGGGQPGHGWPSVRVDARLHASDARRPRSSSRAGSSSMQPLDTDPFGRDDRKRARAERPGQHHVDHWRRVPARRRAGEAHDGTECAMRTPEVDVRRAGAGQAVLLTALEDQAQDVVGAGIVRLARTHRASADHRQ